MRQYLDYGRADWDWMITTPPQFGGFDLSTEIKGWHVIIIAYTCLQKPTYWIAKMINGLNNWKKKIWREHDFRCPNYYTCLHRVYNLQLKCNVKDISDSDSSSTCTLIMQFAINGCPNILCISSHKCMIYILIQKNSIPITPCCTDERAAGRLVWLQ